MYILLVDGLHSVSTCDITYLTSFLTILQTRLDHSSKRNGMISTENKWKPQHGHERVATEQDAQNGFVLPDLNLPADD